MAAIKLNVSFFIQSKPGTWSTFGEARKYSLDSSAVFCIKIKELSKEYNQEILEKWNSNSIVPDNAKVFSVDAENASNKGFNLVFTSANNRMTVDDVVKFFEAEFAKRNFGSVKYYNVHFK